MYWKLSPMLMYWKLSLMLMYCSGTTALAVRALQTAQSHWLFR